MIRRKPSRSAEEWGRRLLIASAVLAGWAGVIWVTGGFLLQLGGFRVSSRNPNRVMLLAVALAMIAWRLAYRDWVGVRLRQLPSAAARFDRRLSSGAVGFVRCAPLLAWTMAAAVLGCGLVYGSRVAGGADAFGYLSESALWRHGRLAVDQSYAASLPWPDALGSFVPLAYRLGANGWMGPTVAPGLPLLMTFAGLFSTCGPYLIVPLCGGALVVSTFHLGKRLFGTGTALAASALVACSPVVVFESLVVMADVPAAALWMSALAVASGTPRATLASGILTGVAILIRPNLLPLALFPWLMSIARCETARSAATRTGLFAAGSLPAACFIGWVNQRLYGSPLSSGYGDLGGAFAVSHAAANLRLYAGWWLESQGALGFLFLLALWRRRPRAREILVLLGYAICAGLMYVFYLPFDQWWYLRFLIPAIPVVFLFAADAVDWAAHRSPSLHVAAMAAFAVAAAVHAIAFMDAKDILGNRIAEQRRYLDGAVYVDRTLPPEAVVLAMQHSGSVRYYAGRLTMRWDVLDPARLDRAVITLRDRGVPVYALIESWEEEDFRVRFSGQRTVDLLMAGASAVSQDGELRLYDLSGARRPGAAAVIPVWRDPACVDASPGFLEPEAARRLAGGR